MNAFLNLGQNLGLNAGLNWLSPYTQSVMDWLEQQGHDHMSPIGMFMAADIVVKAVMVALALASVLVWAIFVARLVLLAWARHRLRRSYRILDRAGDFTRAQPRFAKGRGVVGAMVRAALMERAASKDGQTQGIKDRTDSALSRIEAGAARSMQRGTGVLAITGSAAPFVGLFGTVWGIMNSFVSIAETNTTNLAVVAPGIAEALLATAIGLVAAIPAVIFYNILARANGGYKAMLGDASALVSRTLSRDLDLAPAAAMNTDAPASDMPIIAQAKITRAEASLAQAAE